MPDQDQQHLAEHRKGIEDATTEINALAKAVADAGTGASRDDIAVLVQKLQAATAQLNLAVSNGINRTDPPQENTGGAAVPSKNAKSEDKQKQ